MLTTKTKIAIARLISRGLVLPRRLVGLGPEARVVRSGIRWTLDLREGIDLSIYLFGRFEAATVRAYRRMLKPGDTVLDIGANIGAHTLPLASCVAPSGRVIAVEPTEFAFQKLARAVTDNPTLGARIALRQVMLTSETGSELAPELYSSWSVAESGSHQHALHLGTRKTTRGAKTMTLDDLVRDEGLARIDLIKLDVDGWEMDVLRGAERTLSELRPPLIFELAPYVFEERGHRAEEFLNELAKRGYRFSDLNDKPVDAKRSIERIPHGAGHNLIARAG